MAKAADLCVQRFKSCEVRASGGSAALARQHELIPRRPIGLATEAEQVLVSRQEVQRAKLSEVEQKTKAAEKGAG